MRDQHQKRVLIRGALIGLVFLLAAVGILFFLQQEEQSSQQETRGTMSEGFGQLKTVTVNGKTYREKPAVTTLLLYGVDKDDSVAEEGTQVNYRNGGQADFLLILAIDHTDKEIYQLQIDRDTMSPVQVLGVFGNEVGSRIMQICLAHFFGATPKDNAEYTVKAVQTLLGGVDIDGYYGVNFNAIPVLNDVLGGVTVTIPDDMTGANPDWTAGTEVQLKGKDAETFVRSRMTVGDGTNAARAIRQQIYMNRATEILKQRLKEDPKFADTFLNTLSPLATTNMTGSRLLNEMTRAVGYKVNPVESLPGEHVVNARNYMEFHAVEGSGVEWVLKRLYSEQ